MSLNLIVKAPLSVNAQFVEDQNGNSSSLSLTKDGHVGIGTKTPGTKLEVDGDIKLTGIIRSDVFRTTTNDWEIARNGEHLEIREPEQSGKVWAKFVDDQGFHLIGTPNLWVDGKIGIGTDQPLAELHTHNKSANSDLRISHDSPKSNNVLEFYEGATHQASIIVRGSGIPGGPPNAMNIYVSVDGAPITLGTKSGEKLRITDEGCKITGITRSDVFRTITDDWEIARNGENLEIREPEQADKVWAKFIDDKALHLISTPDLWVNGKIGIATTSPSADYRLHVLGDGLDAALFDGKVEINNELHVDGKLNCGDSILGNDLSGFGAGVWGWSHQRDGVHGRSNYGNAISGSTWDGVGGWNGYAGYFDGPVRVLGYLHKQGGGFEIDHPLDPANKYLRHSFVESTDMMNIYNGNVTLDEKGEAWIDLPQWFEALNKDFRYQLTCISSYAPVYIAEKIAKNRFKIAGGIPEIEISWQVTGIRRDGFANAHPFQVEVQKNDKERGKYLCPEAHSLPANLAIDHQRRKEAEQVYQKYNMERKQNDKK